MRFLIRSEDMPTLLPTDKKIAEKVPQSIDTATFGLGCFWSPDAQFGILEGVVRTRVGYAGALQKIPIIIILEIILK
ncbi:MAG: peptide-methionine (S)-S-oxide reductase [Richelia sp. CSU_2_1]|nr:peptide-methionine (S)-S-oxide reductase [Richelia sp. CSU_2_1]